MDGQTADIDRGAAGVLRQMSVSAPASELSLEAATPLVTLPPDLVALIVERVRAGVSAFGADHPRAAITRRIVLPSAALAVLDAVGLIAAAVTGHIVLAVVAAVLLIVLAYLAFAGVRFVRSDPLRVTTEQRSVVETAKTWRSDHPWTDGMRAGPWGRLVGVGCGDAGRIAASDAWTWPSIAAQRAETELAHVLTSVDDAAFAHAASDRQPTADALLVRRVGALHCYADALDDLVRRAAHGTDVRDVLPRAEDGRLTGLLTFVRTPGSEPS